MRFKSAVDTSFYWLALILPLFTFVLVGVLVSNSDPSALPLLGVVAFFSLGLSVWLLLTTHYTVNDETLIVRSGPFKWTIPLDTIVLVKPTHSVLSSPALSMQRLEIHYGKSKRLLVSPQDQQGFLSAIGQPAETTGSA